MSTTIFSYAFLIGSIYMFINFFRVVFFYTYTLKTWNKVVGEVVSSSPEFYQSNVDLDTQGWKEKVVYNYKINDVDYYSTELSKNVNFLMPFPEGVDKLKLLAIGTEINVFYNSNNFNDSVVESKFSPKNFIFLIFGLMSFLVYYCV